MAQTDFLNSDVMFLQLYGTVHFLKRGSYLREEKQQQENGNFDKQHQGK
jgi:hypothetical protein